MIKNIKIKKIFFKKERKIMGFDNNNIVILE